MRARDFQATLVATVAPEEGVPITGFDPERGGFDIRQLLSEHPRLVVERDPLTKMSDSLVVP